MPVRLVEPMRIEVTGEDDPNNSQARAYAEYKVFAALAHHTQRVRSAQVLLHRDHRSGRCDSVACAVPVVLEPCGVVRTHARGPHAYAAINRTAERLGDLMRRAA